jgi:hypothetical protein
MCGGGYCMRRREIDLESTMTNNSSKWIKVIIEGLK